MPFLAAGCHRFVTILFACGYGFATLHVASQRSGYIPGGNGAIERGHKCNGTIHPRHLVRYSLRSAWFSPTVPGIAVGHTGFGYQCCGVGHSVCGISTDLAVDCNFHLQPDCTWSIALLRSRNGRDAFDADDGLRLLVFHATSLAVCTHYEKGS